MAAGEEPGFEVVPTRVGGPPGGGGSAGSGRPRLRIVIVILAALAIPAVALAGPRIEWRPEIDLSALRPTPTPDPTPSAPPSPAPTATPVPTATPLPAVTIGSGPLPSEPLPIDAAGFRLIDPSTATPEGASEIRLDNDAIFRQVGGDGWSCVCFAHTQSADSETVTVTVRHFDGTLTETERFPIGTYKGVAPAGRDAAIRLGLERSADGRLAFLAIGVRNLERWTVLVDAIDIAAGRLLGSTKLATIRLPAQPPASPPSTDPSIDTYLDGPTIRIAPDGLHLVVIASLNPNAETGRPGRHAWLLEVARGASSQPFGAVRPVEARLLAQLESCALMTWLAPDELLMTCWDPAGASGRATVSTRTFDLSGRQIGGASFELGDGASFVAPLIDKANRLVYFWEPETHTLHRLDPDRGTADALVVDPASGQAASTVQDAGRGSDQPPMWTRDASEFPTYTWTQLAAAPGQTRIYALGMTRTDPAIGNPDVPFGSTGVWVFDTTSFSVVDHWAPAADYMSIAVTPDGRWLTATGQTGVDVAGNMAGWESSVTIHDTQDGRLALQLGRLGQIAVETMP